MTRAAKKTSPMDTTVAKYHRIQEALGSWNPAGDRKANAARVLEAAKAEGYVFHCTPAQVAVFMGEMPFWNQGAANYLDVAIGLSKVLQSTKQNPNP